MSTDTPVDSPKPDHPTFKNGDIVWTKLGSSWWPGEVKSQDDLPTDMNSDFKKPPLVIVKFFEEDSYEYVKNWSHIYPYNCDKKVDFIKKGMVAFRTKAAHMEKFPKDVTQAEEMTGGNPNILSDPVFLPPKKFNYSELFSTPSPNPKKLKSTSNFGRRSTPYKNSALITHRRFLGHDDYKAFVCVQYPGKFKLCEDEDGKDALNEDEGELIECKPCGFSTKRLAVMMIHAKMHLNSTNKKKMKPARKKKDTKTKKETYTDLLDEWSDEDQDSGSKENGSHIKESPKETALSEKKTPRTYSKKSKIEYLEEKSWEDSDLVEFLKKDKSMAKKSPKSKKPAEDKETSKTAQITDEDIKNCFDFDEEEEDQDLIIATTPGRKIPRIIPEKTKSPRTEELEHTLEDDLTDISRDEILRTSHSFNKDPDDKGTDNLEDIFKEVMEETSIPQVERLINNFKPEQNFHDGRTVKTPDKCGLSDSETGRLSPKKRFVKSFEDFETEVNKKKDLSEEKREKKPVETSKQSNKTSKITKKGELLKNDKDSEKREDVVTKVINNSKESPKTSRSTRQTKLSETVAENKTKEVDKEISTIEVTNKEVSLAESNAVIIPISKVESPSRRARHSDLKVLSVIQKTTQAVETISSSQSSLIKEPKASSSQDVSKETIELPIEDVKLRRSGRHHVDPLDHPEIAETSKSDDSSISVTVAENENSTCESNSNINQSDSDIEISLKLADSSITENQELKSRRSLSRERQNKPIGESRRSTRHHKVSEHRPEEEKLLPSSDNKKLSPSSDNKKVSSSCDNKKSKKHNRNTSKEREVEKSLLSKENESIKHDSVTKEISSCVIDKALVEVKVPLMDEKKSERKTRHKISEHVTAKDKTSDEHGRHTATESSIKKSNEVGTSKDERKSRQTRLIAAEHITKGIETNQSPLEKLELEKPSQYIDIVAENSTVEPKSEIDISEVEDKSPIFLEKSIENKRSRRQTRHRTTEHDTQSVDTNELTLVKPEVDKLVILEKLPHDAESKSEAISKENEKCSTMLEESVEIENSRRQTRSKAAGSEVEKSPHTKQIDPKSEIDILKVEEESPIIRAESFDTKKSKRTRHRVTEHITAEVDRNQSILRDLEVERPLVQEKPSQHEQTEQEAEITSVAEPKSEIVLAKLEEKSPIVAEAYVENKKFRRQTRHRATVHVTAEVETLESPEVEKSLIQDQSSQIEQTSVAHLKSEKDVSKIEEKRPITPEESIENKKSKRQTRHKAVEHVTADINQTIVETKEKSSVVLDESAENKKSTRQTRNTSQELLLETDKEPSPIEAKVTSDESLIKEKISKEQTKHTTKENANEEINDQQKSFEKEEEPKTALGETLKPEEKRRGRPRKKESVESAEVKSTEHSEQSTFEYLDSTDVMTPDFKNKNVFTLEEYSLQKEKSRRQSRHTIRQTALEESKIEPKPSAVENSTVVSEGPTVEKTLKGVENSFAEPENSLNKPNKSNQQETISAKSITEVVIDEVKPIEIISPKIEETVPKTPGKKGRGRPRNVLVEPSTGKTFEGLEKGISLEKSCAEPENLLNIPSKGNQQETLLAEPISEVVTVDKVKPIENPKTEETVAKTPGKKGRGRPRNVLEETTVEKTVEGVERGITLEKLCAEPEDALSKASKGNEQEASSAEPITKVLTVDEVKPIEVISSKTEETVAKTLGKKGIGRPRNVLEETTVEKTFEGVEKGITVEKSCGEPENALGKASKGNEQETSSAEPITEILTVDEVKPIEVISSKTEETVVKTQGKNERGRPRNVSEETKIEKSFESVEKGISLEKSCAEPENALDKPSKDSQQETISAEPITEVVTVDEKKPKEIISPNIEETVTKTPGKKGRGRPRNVSEEPTAEKTFEGVEKGISLEKSCAEPENSLDKSSKGNQPETILAESITEVVTVDEVKPIEVISRKTEETMVKTPGKKGRGRLKNVSEESTVQKTSDGVKKDITLEKTCSEPENSLNKPDVGNQQETISAEPITAVVTVDAVKPIEVISSKTEETVPQTPGKKGRGRPRKSSKLESLSESIVEDKRPISGLEPSDKVKEISLDKQSSVISESPASSSVSPKKIRENEKISKQQSQKETKDNVKHKNEKESISEVSKDKKHSPNTSTEKQKEKMDRRKIKSKEDLNILSTKTLDKTPEKSKSKHTELESSSSKKTTEKTPEKNKSKHEDRPETHLSETKDTSRKTKDKKPSRRDSSGESKAKKPRKEESKSELQHGLRERRARTTYSEEEKILQKVLKESAEEAKRLEALKTKGNEQDKHEIHKHTPEKKYKTSEKKDKKESIKDLADKREGHKPDKKDKKDIKESPEKTEGSRALRRRTTKVSEEDRILEKVLRESAEEARLLAEQSAAKELKQPETLNKTQDKAAEESTSRNDNLILLDQKMLIQEKLETSPSKLKEPIDSPKKGERRSRWDSAMSGSTPEKPKPVGIPLGVVVDTKQKSIQNLENNEDNQLTMENTVTEQLFENVESLITKNKDVIHSPPIEKEEKIPTEVVDRSMDTLTEIVKPAMLENQNPIPKLPESLKEPSLANVFLEPPLKEKSKDTVFTWAKPTRRLSEDKIFLKKMVEPKIKIKISSKLVTSTEEAKSDDAFKTLQPISLDLGSNKISTSSGINLPFNATPIESVLEPQKIESQAPTKPILDPKRGGNLQRINTSSKGILVGEISSVKQSVLESKAEKPKLVEPEIKIKVPEKEQLISESKNTSVYDFPSDIDIDPSSKENSKKVTQKKDISSTVFSSQSIYDFSFDVSEIPLPPGSPKKPDVKPVELISLPPLEEIPLPETPVTDSVKINQEIPLPETPVTDPVKINRKEQESIQEEPIPPKKGRWSKLHSNSKEDNRFNSEGSSTFQGNRKDYEEDQSKKVATACGHLATEGSEIILPFKKSRRVTESSTSLIEDEFSFKEDDTSSSLQQNINDALNFLMQDTASPARKSGTSNSIDMSKIIDDKISDVIPTGSGPQDITPTSETLQDVTPAGGILQDITPSSSTQDDILRKTNETQKGVPPKKKKLDIPLEELESQKISIFAFKEEISQPPKKKLQKFFENSHVSEKSWNSDMPLMSPLAKKKSFAFQEDFFETNQVQAEKLNLKEDMLVPLSKMSKPQDFQETLKTENINLYEKGENKELKSEELRPKTIEIIPKNAKVESLVIEEQQVEVSQDKIESAVPIEAVTEHIETENEKIDSLETSIKEIIPQEAKIEEIPKSQEVVCNQVTLDFETGHFTATATTGLDSIKKLQEANLPKEENQNFISLIKERISTDFQKQKMLDNTPIELSKNKADEEPSVSKNIDKIGLFKIDKPEASQNDTSLGLVKDKQTEKAAASKAVNLDDAFKLTKLEIDIQNVKPIETDLKKREKIVIKVSKDRKLASSDAFSAHLEQIPSSSKSDQIKDSGKDFLDNAKEVKYLVKEKILTSKIPNKPKTEVLKDTSKGKLVIKVTESKSKEKDSIKPLASLKPEVIKSLEQLSPKPEEDNVVMGTKPDVIPDPPIEAELVEIEENLIQTISQKELADTQVTITSEQVITEKKPQGLVSLLTMADFSESSNSSVEMPDTKKSTAGTEFTMTAMTKALDNKMPVSKSLAYGRLELLDILEGNSNSNSSASSNEPSFKKMFEKAVLSQTVVSSQSSTMSNQVVTQTEKVIETTVHTESHSSTRIYPSSGSTFQKSLTKKVPNTIPFTKELTASVSGESSGTKAPVKSGVTPATIQSTVPRGSFINEATLKKAFETPIVTEPPDQAVPKLSAINQPIILNQSISRESASFKNIMEKPFGFNPPNTKESLMKKTVDKPVITPPSPKKEAPKKPVGKGIMSNENRKETAAKKPEKPVLSIPATMPANPPIILNKPPVNETNKTESSSAQSGEDFEDFEDSIPCSAIIMAKPETVPSLAELDTIQDSSKLFERLSQPQKVVIQSDIKVKEAPKPVQFVPKAQPPVKLPVKPKLQGLPGTPTTKLQGVAPGIVKPTSRKPIILSEQIIRPATVASPSLSSSAVSQVQASAVKRPFEDIEDVEQPFIIKKVARVEEAPPQELRVPDPSSPTKKKGRAGGKAKILQHSIIPPQRKITKSTPPPKTFPASLSKAQPVTKLKPGTTQGQLLMTTASQTSTSTTTQSQASTSQADDAMFDINSMPIVLSDEIITAENIETMPVVLSNESVAIPGTSAVGASKPAAVKEKVVPKMPPKKQALLTGVGLSKTASLPALSPTSQLMSTDVKLQPKPKTPGGAISTFSKVPVAGGLLTTPGSKNAKFLLVSSNAANQATQRVVGSAKQILVNKPSTTAPQLKPAQTGVPQPKPAQPGTLQLKPTQTGAPQPKPAQTGVPQHKPAHTGVPLTKPTQTGVVTTDPNSGSKIMIVTNQQGEAHRLLLTPTQQKMLGMQTQDEKDTKPVTKGPAFKGGLLVEALAGLSSHGPVSPTLTTAQKQNSLSVSGPSSQAQASTSGLSTGRNILSSASRLGKLPLPKKYQAKTGKQKTILIKNQLGETVTKIQGTDDDELDRQVAEQLAAIKATAMLQAQEAAQRSGQEPRTSAVPVGTAPTTPKPGMKAVPKRTPPKKSEYVRPKFGVQTPGSTQLAQRLLEGITSANSAPSLSPLGGTQKPQHLKKTLVEKPQPPVVPQKVPTATVKDDRPIPSTHLQQQPAPPAQLSPLSASQSLTAADNKKPDRPLQQLVIQDPTGNRTTITEGQILALPSETVDGQPQSYMLITLDEFGNLTPLNNEALMNLDPSLALGGDLNNMVLQVDQGQGVLAPASAVANKADVVAPIITDQQKVAERIKDSVNEPKEHDKPEIIQKSHKKAPEPAKPVQKPHHKLPSPVQTAPPPLESVQLATEHLEAQDMLPELHVSLGDPPDGDPSQGQQLMVTGDPVITQKFLESLSDGSTDLASILATDGGALLLEIDGQQILIRTNSQLEGATLMPASEISEGDGNPIFSPPHKPNQDILAAALANTDVFQQQDSPTSMMNKDGLLPPGAGLSPNSAGGTLYPMHVGNVLETSLTLSAPIMTPLEAPSLPHKKIADEADILSQVPKNPGDLPITITDPNILQTVAHPPPLAELSLPPLTETPCISTRIEATCSPSFSYGLSFIELSKDGAKMSRTTKAQTQNSYNGNMPLLTDDLTEESPVVTKTDDVKEDIALTETTSSSTESLLDAGLCTLGGSMCSSLSEPPPDMFELPEKEEEISSDQSNSVPEAETLSLNSDNSGEIPLQPPIVAKLSDIKRLERGSESGGESSDTFGPKRAKFD